MRRSHMPAIERYISFISPRSSQPAKQRQLLGLHWSHKVVSAVQHQDGYSHARCKIDSVDFRRLFFTGQSYPGQNSSPDPRLQCQNDYTRPTPVADTEIAELAASNIGAGFQVI